MNEDDIVKDDLSEEGLGDIIKEQDRKLKERYDEINYRNKRLRQRQLRQRGLDNRGLTDDQIREKIKEQDAQRAKENLPSQSPQERRKQQRDMEEGDYLQDPEIDPLRFSAGLLVEIFGNVGLDALQAASTLTGPAGLAATTSLQSGGSAFFNYLNQKIRGEKEINQGEMAAASAASLIPGLQPFRAATKAGRFYKNVLRGSTTGIIDVTGTKLGRGEEVTPTDLTLGAVGGGLLGSVFSAKDAKFAYKSLKDKVVRGSDKLVNDLGVFIQRQTPLISQGAGSTFNPSQRRLATPTDDLYQGLLFSEKELAPYTFKVRQQPWEKSPENLLEQTTGIPQKLEQPLPYGQKYNLIRDEVRGRPLRSITKKDLDLREFRIGKAPIDEVVRNFRRRIIALMQIDRIRSEDVGTKVGFNRTATNINKFTEGTSEISSTYFDYLTGYFNRFIRPGKVQNFDGAVNLVAPKIKGNEVIPNQVQTVKGNPALMRELKLFTIAPDVYGSGAFKTSDKTYQSKLKRIITKISLVDEEGAFKVWDKRSETFKYKVDAHHMDQIAEGWPLYEGLPKEEIPKMRRLVTAYGLNPGNHPKNVLLLLKQDHVKYHSDYWPAARKELETTGEGWPTLNEQARQKLLAIKTAEGRQDYVKRYVKVIDESRDKVETDAYNRLEELARKQKKEIEQLTAQDIERIDDEIQRIDPSDPLDRTPAPDDIQKDIDEG